MDLTKLAVAQRETPSISYQRDEDMVFRRLGEEMVLVPIRKGIGEFDSFYVLNELGTFLWQQLGSLQAESKLLNSILVEFNVSKEEAQKDLHSFLQELLKLNAIKKFEENP